jgi:hypothetical protein
VELAIHLGGEPGSDPDHLNARLFAIGDHRDIGLGIVALPQDRDLAIDAEDICHLCIECLVASFEIVADLVRLRRVMGEDFADRALNDFRQTRMSGSCGVLADVARQQPRGPKLVWIRQFFRFLAVWWLTPMPAPLSPWKYS